MDRCSPWSVFGCCIGGAARAQEITGSIAGNGYGQVRWPVAGATVTIQIVDKNERCRSSAHD